MILISLLTYLAFEVFLISLKFTSTNILGAIAHRMPAFTNPFPLPNVKSSNSYSSWLSFNPESHSKSKEKLLLSSLSKPKNIFN